MINDFLTKFLSKNPIMDDYGLKYNHTFSEEILTLILYQDLNIKGSLIEIELFPTLIEVAPLEFI